MDILEDKTLSATQKAIQYFGELDGEAMFNILLDDTEMSRSSGFIKIGTTTINPKNSNAPNRVIIDADPDYPHVLIRAIRREIAATDSSQE